MCHKIGDQVLEFHNYGLWYCEEVKCFLLKGIVCLTSKVLTSKGVLPTLEELNLGSLNSCPKDLEGKVIGLI